MSGELVVEPIFPFDRQMLRCPWCQSPYTHIDEVFMQARDQDAPITSIQVRLDTAAVSVLQTDQTKGRYSDRRHSVALGIGCENCNKTGRIAFAQHKGITEVFIEETGE